MSKYNPIRTADPDLSRVQDRVSEMANATSARLNDLQTQVDTNSKTNVGTANTSASPPANQHVTIVNTTSGMVIQLPDATKVTSVLYYKNTSGSNALTLVTQSVNGRQQTINGLAFFSVATSSTATLVSDGSDFHTL